MNKFSSLNQKVKQTKSNVNISNLRKLGNFTKPEMKVNFLKPNLKVNLWKSDSSLETMENAMTDTNANIESDIEISSDNDSFHSDDFLTNSRSDDDQQFLDSLENGQIDYVLPSCGIIASAPRLNSRSQSVSSTDINISIPVPSDIHVAQSGHQMNNERERKTFQEALSAENTTLDVTKQIDVYCHRFVQDAKIKMNNSVLECERGSEELPEVVHNISNNAPKAADCLETNKAPSRPSKLDVSFSETGPQYLVVEQMNLFKSHKSPGSSIVLEAEQGFHATPSPAENNGSRAVSPFAKIRNSMAQVANITQAGLTQGINFAVAKVQKSPAEPETINESQQNELKEMFTQCQTRIIQI